MAKKPARPKKPLKPKKPVSKVTKETTAEVSPAVVKAPRTTERANAQPLAVDPQADDTQGFEGIVCAALSLSGDSTRNQVFSKAQLIPIIRAQLNNDPAAQDFQLGIAIDTLVARPGTCLRIIAVDQYMRN
jgi:hypothetical protein